MANELEEERDQLLRSLDQLDEEHAAGDLDDEDYHQLRDRYTVQAAAVMRRLTREDRSSGSGRAPTETKGAGDGGRGRQGGEPGEGEPNRPGRAGRRVLVVGGLALFAVLAGLLLARASGERGVDDEITGSIDSPRDEVVRCQELGSLDGDLVGALECFDQLLVSDPLNAEALSYRGWYLLLAAGALSQSATEESQQLEAESMIESGLEYLGQAIAADPELPDPYAFRATVYDRLERSEEACADLAVLQTLDPPQFFLDQTAEIGQRNDC